MQRWIAPDAEFAAVEPGLKRIYGQGRQRLRAAQAKPTSANLHAWRKRVKDLRYSAEILAPAGPKRMRRTAKRADRLGELLGEEHDLALLGDLVERRAELFADDAGRRGLLKLIGRRRSRLRREALRRGDKLYARKPGAFVGRTARAWREQASG
jgi:CHAD domain-containing protein